MSKRSSFYGYYNKSKEQRDLERLIQKITDATNTLAPLEKSAASIAHQERFTFKGNALVESVVIRCDLNGYSTWARSKSLSERASLLDDFFSTVFAELDKSGGVYFRDEGDCFVALFSSYFNPTFSYTQIETFCSSIVGKTYGSDQLTSKAIIACGQVAIFQKNHEIGTEDWSAEGEPFVLAARVEQAIDSKQRIYYFQDDYDRHLRTGTSWAAPGGRYFWSVSQQKIQIKGIGKTNAWVDFSVHEYIPGGRVSGQLTLKDLLAGKK